MSGKVFIGFLVYSLMCYNSERTLASELNKKDVTDILNALLGHSRWAQITDVEAKHLDSTNHIPFSGKDIFINRGWFSRTKNIGNSCVSVENVYNKYYMITSLLACVYAKVIDEFTTLIKNLLKLSGNERRLLQNRASNARYIHKLKESELENEASQQMQRKRFKTDQQHDQTHGQNTDDSDDDMHTLVVDEESEDNRIDGEDEISEKCLNNQELANYKNSWKVFSFTYQQLLNSQQMFKYMYDSLFYLLSLVLPIEYSLHCHIIYIQKILLLMEWFKDVSVNLKILFPTYIGVDDVDYKSKVGRFAKKLFTSINIRYHRYLKPFGDKYCIFQKEDNKPIKKILKKFQKEFPNHEKTDIMYQFEKKIQDLSKKAINEYFFDLGFVF